MKNSRWKSIGESITMALGAILLGFYLASSAEQVAIQVAMLSFPPASLWLAVRHNRSSTEPLLQQVPESEPEALSHVIAMAQALEVERLVQAS
jgi:hypothetical protein